MKGFESSEGVTSSSSESSPHSCKNNHYGSATSRHSCLLFFPPSTCGHSLDMNDTFSTWQSRLHQGHQNVVPDSLAPHEIENLHGSDVNCQSQAHAGSQSYGANRLSLPTFSSQQTKSGAQFEDSKFENGEPQQTLRPTGDPITKKRASKMAVKKGKKGKTAIVLSDDDDGVDGVQVKRWTDPEVSQLIAFRSEMDDDFKQNAKKQGINMWEKLQIRMVAACDNFGKSAEACRKKWKAIYNLYCNDKRILQISGEGRKISCKFFYEIDEGFNNSANVRKLCHGDARGNPNPCPPDLNDQWEAQDSANATIGSEPSKELSPLGSKAPKKSPTEHIASFMGDLAVHTADMVDCSCQMATATNRIVDDIHANGMVLKELQFHMAKLIEKL